MVGPLSHGAGGLIPKLADPDSCCEHLTGTSIAKRYSGPMGYGHRAQADGGADESMPPQFGIIEHQLQRRHCRERSQQRKAWQGSGQFASRSSPPTLQTRATIICNGDAPLRESADRTAKLRSFPRKRESRAKGWVPATGSPRRERRGVPLAGTSEKKRHYPRCATAENNAVGGGGWMVRCALRHVPRMRCSAKWCTADPGPPRTGTVPGLQRTIRHSASKTRVNALKAHAALRPGHAAAARFGRRATVRSSLRL